MAIFRIIFVSVLVLIGLGASFHGPLNALLFYIWVAYFRPDVWVENSFLLSLRFSLIVGIILIILVFIKGVKLRFTPFAGLLLLTLIHSLLSTLLSNYSDTINWVDFLKVIVVTYLITMLVESEKDLKLVLIVITLSLGLFDGAKLGWTHLILYPGRLIWNKHPSMGDNNYVAVAMLMITPMLIALSQTAERKIIKYGYIFLAIGVIYRALSTYSRGGFLTFLVMCIIFWMRSRYKVRVLLIAVLLAALILPTFPQSFWDRMETIAASSDEQDGSVRGRLYFWGIAWEMAKKNPIFGVGHNSYGKAYLNFDPSHDRGWTVHSAWFGILSEWGFPGLIIYLSIYLYSLFSCARVRKKCKDRPELRNLVIFSNSIETSLIAAAVGITFLSFQYYEILWNFFGLAVVSHQILQANNAPDGDQLITAIEDDEYILQIPHRK